MSGKSKPCPSCWLLVGPFETKCPRCGTALGGHPTVMEPGYVSKNLPPSKMQCKNCETISERGTSLCPSCGQGLTGPEYTRKIWPPNSSGEPDEGPIVVPLMTPYVWLDITLGAIASLVGVVGVWVTYGLSLIPVIAVYSYTIRRFPVFVRGMNYGFTSIVFIALTQCLICVGAPVYSWLKSLLPWLPGVVLAGSYSVRHLGGAPIVWFREAV